MSVGCHNHISRSALFGCTPGSRYDGPPPGKRRGNRSSSTVASRSSFRRGPPPSRRTRPRASGAASRSFKPRSIVLRANPVTLETAARPPYRDSADLTRRKQPSPSLVPSRTVSFPPKSNASLSIMPTLLSLSTTTGDHVQPSHSVAAPRKADSATYGYLRTFTLKPDTQVLPSRACELKTVSRSLPFAAARIRRVGKRKRNEQISSAWMRPLAQILPGTHYRHWHQPVRPVHSRVWQQPADAQAS
jgi:hypothetical protein